MPLTAIASALTTLATSGIAPPSKLSMHTFYGDFPALMSSLGPELSGIVLSPHCTPHYAVEFTPEDFVNKVDWASFPALRMMCATCRRPGAVDPRPFTDLRPVASPPVELDFDPDLPSPYLTISLVYPPDQAVMHAQLRHDVNRLPVLVRALKVVLPNLRPTFRVCPAPTIGPGGEGEDLEGGVSPSLRWNCMLDMAVETVWGELEPDDEEEGTTDEEENSTDYGEDTDEENTDEEGVYLQR
ncbi:hypothetical protein IAT38_006237 [Cryptococcus sp. DSM 104549]